MSSTSITADDASWLDLFRGANALRVLVLAAGVALHAINLYLTTTILPSVVDDIGGVAFYAWNTTLFIVASITGAAVAAQVIQHLGPRGAYLLGAMVFGGGSALCALAPIMQVLLVGRVLQGLGGGVLLSAPYVLMRSVLPEPLWPRALALLSGMWGIATLLGPAVGGIFAQYATWRLAFWSLVVLIALAAAAAVVVLKPAAPQAERPTPVPTRQLVLLAVAVVAASWASVSDSPWLGALGLIAAALTLLAIRRVEMRSSRRILPADAYTGRTALAALYGVSALLAVTVTCTEIFVPLFPATAAWAEPADCRLHRGHGVGRLDARRHPERCAARGVGHTRDPLGTVGVRAGLAGTGDAGADRRGQRVDDHADHRRAHAGGTGRGRCVAAPGQPHHDGGAGGRP